MQDLFSVIHILKFTNFLNNLFYKVLLKNVLHSIFSFFLNFTLYVEPSQRNLLLGMRHLTGHFQYLPTQINNLRVFLVRCFTRACVIQDNMSHNMITQQCVLAKSVQKSLHDTVRVFDTVGMRAHKDDRREVFFAICNIFQGMHHVHPSHYMVEIGIFAVRVRHRATVIAISSRLVEQTL